MREKVKIISLIWILLVTGCSNSSIINRHSVQFDHFEKKEIVIWHTYGELETEIFENEIIPLYEKNNPNIVIKSERKSYTDQLKRSLISRVTANRPPDIVRMDIIWVPFFAYHELLYPLDNLQAFPLTASKLRNRPLTANVHQGNHYGIPINMNTKASIYNKKMLESANIETLPSTMQELIDVAKENHFKIIFSGFYMWDLLPYYFAFGGQLFDSTYTKAVGYLNSRESIEAVYEMLNLYKKGILVPKVFSNIDDPWKEVVDGDLFMIDEGPWYFSTKFGDRLTTTLNQAVVNTFPITDGVSSVLGGESLVIMKSTQMLEESWDFIQWMATSEPQELMLRAGLIPTNTNVEFDKKPDDQHFWNVYMTGIDNALIRPSLAAFDQVDEVFSVYMRSIFEGSIDIEEGLTKAAIELEAILEQFNKTE